jgi:glutamate/tyrosine decarboxylase-like PLP-dependent enzyme
MCWTGTTVLGAVDPLPELADVCSTHGLWLHVDAAWGGGLLFSHNHRHLLKGIHRFGSKILKINFYEIRN